METLRTLNNFRKLIRWSDERLKKTFADQKVGEEVIDLIDDGIREDDEYVCAV
jgi:hypothetical protein